MLAFTQKDIINTSSVSRLEKAHAILVRLKNLVNKNMKLNLAYINAFVDQLVQSHAPK